MAMVMDFLIGFLLLLSAAINILALGAFFVTPSLRSTSNRFVINLLIVNVIGCLILAPSLMFNSNIIRRLYSDEPAVTVIVMGNDEAAAAGGGTPKDELLARNSTAFSRHEPSPTASPAHRPQIVVRNGKGAINSTTKPTWTYKIDPQLDAIDANSTPIVPQSEQAVDNTETSKSLDDDTPFTHQIRPWILDVIAAIGALSLVLVVGDTYCAVTDPLRYHTRVSASRVFFLILVVWCVALGFGVSSALRTHCIDDITLQHSLYNNIYGTTYFLCIILVPFSLVCCMYWGIISEARKNGLRLRHNGSSPLLQSVLHMDPHQAAQQCLQIEEEEHQQQLQQEQQCKKGSTSSDVGQTGTVAPSKLIENGVENRITGAEEGIKSPPRGELTNHVSAEAQAGNLRRNKSAQHLLMGPSAQHCECCETILITRSISNQSAYLNRGTATSSSYLTVPNRELMIRNAARSTSTPDLLRQNLLGGGGGGRVGRSRAVAGCKRGVNGFEHMTSLEHILIAPRPTTKSLGYMTSIRHRLSNASSLFKYREESRAARISVLVVIMFLVSYIPFGLLVLTEGRNSLLSTYQQTVLAILFVVLVNIMSPLIFAYRNKRVRRGIKRLVSKTGGKGNGGGGGGGGRCAGHTKDQRKGDTPPLGNPNNNGSVKELLRRNSSPRKIRLARDRDGDINSSASCLASDHNNNSNSSPNQGDCGRQRRKLVIFNGKNGQITKVCHSDHHKDFIQLGGGGGGSAGIVKGCGGNKEQPHTPGLWRANGGDECSAAAATAVIGCPSHSLRLTTGANHKPKVKSAFASPAGAAVVAEAPFLRRIKNTSGHIFKRSTAAAAVLPSSPPPTGGGVPEVNIDFPSKPIDV